jgi:hypothetical protein
MAPKAGERAFEYVQQRIEDSLEILSSRLDLAFVAFEQPRHRCQTAPGSHRSDSAFLAPCLKAIIDDSHLQISDRMLALAFERS